MRALINVSPSPEQLSLASRVNVGVKVITGAAGSGKTTTALLTLRSYISVFSNRRRRENSTDPVRVLVLTYNRTLSGYISALVDEQFETIAGVELEISTFGKWAMKTLRHPKIVDDQNFFGLIQVHLSKLKLSESFIKEELDYLTGRFMPEKLSQYLTMRRDGRGGTPRMERAIRESLLDDLVYPYMDIKIRDNLHDWNDLAIKLAQNKYYRYDIIIADETQDFSANQIRAIMNQTSEVHAVTFVLDTAQRIYARGFTWQEVGITVRPENSFRLSNNYRNTKQIAMFAAALVDGINSDDNGTPPNVHGASRDGSKPLILKGYYPAQVKYAINYIKATINLRNESVAFLHAKGGGWFNYLRNELNNTHLQFIEISSTAQWPNGPENIALSTLHSAKGLEFDHVIILGLDANTLQHGDGHEDQQLTTLRLLLAMAIGRAKHTVIIGYTPTDISSIVSFFDKTTFDEVLL